MPSCEEIDKNWLKIGEKYAKMKKIFLSKYNVKEKIGNGKGLIYFRRHYVF